MCVNAQDVKDLSQNWWLLLGFSNFCPFLNMFGRKSELLIDFISGLPKSYSRATILVVVDRLFKAAYFMALKHLFTVVDMANMFMDNVV